MRTSEKKDSNPLVLKFGAALALSFVGFLCNQLRNKSTRPSLPPPPSPPSDPNEEFVCGDDVINEDASSSTSSCPEMDSNSEAHSGIDNGLSSPSPCTRRSSDKDGFLLPELNELIENFDIAPSGDVLTIDVGVDEIEQEIQSLRSMVTDLRERERSLEVELLEYYGLKEQMSVMELQKRLKINSVEARVLFLKIESLQVENRRLEDRVADYVRVVDELEAARAKINVLKTKLRSDAEQNKERILRLEQRVLMLDRHEKDHDMLAKMQRLEGLENEVEELRKSKYELERENSELTWRLESTQPLADSMLDQLKVEELENEVSCLGDQKENLLKEVERLQSERCADVEELVYLRWINACLRYELRNCEPPPGKIVARDLSKSMSPKSEAKAKQLIFEYANNSEEKAVSVVDFDYEQWSDSGELDGSLVDASLSATKVQHPKKTKFLDRIRRRIIGKDSYYHNDRRNKPCALVRSRSNEDLGKAFSYVVQRPNSISTPSSSSTSFESMKRSFITSASSRS